jgi:5-methylcytosine-specific restriction endonuclease McrA
LTVDHIIPLVDLHPELRYEISNLQVLCRRCNSRKGDR